LRAKASFRALRRNLLLPAFETHPGPVEVRHVAMLKKKGKAGRKFRSRSTGCSRARQAIIDAIIVK
jgi:hypothetical protein